MGTEASGDGTEDGPWLTVAEAARRLGVSPRAVRGRIRRGTLRWKAAGNAGKLVQLPSGDPSGDVLADDPGEAQGYELELLREELMEARVAQARAEERASAKEQVIEELKAMLAEARRPWWRRLWG